MARRTSARSRSTTRLPKKQAKKQERPIPIRFDGRLLRREVAAAYLGVSPSQLDLLRQQGEVMPVAVPSDRSPSGVMVQLVAYDRLDLDRAIERWKAQRPN
jgi:hypothetical protein